MQNKIAMLVLLALSISLSGAVKEKSTSQSVEINAPASKVWPVLVDADHWVDDNPAVKQSKLISGDGEKAGSLIEYTPVVGKVSPVKLKVTLTVSEKNQKLEYVADQPGVKMVMGFELTEKNGVTTLTNYERASGFIPQAVSQANMDEEHRLWAKAVKNRVENPKGK
jgi:carbon monoxide dehydrogenase subunit G